ncbi:formin-like protein 2 [Poecilia formosa]|uniref:formin-like protein 2 n=1 Tax=Poecilia formosa TaxID=48698 RepID=UPI0007BA01D8|nr:PREDICTED: formin-like protein 2 [Poecilia formosa]
MINSFPYLEFFLGFLGFGLSILFCTSFCRSCARLREEQLEREAQLDREQRSQMRSIYFIPFPQSNSRRDSDESNELTPPRYSTTIRHEPPPSYNELGFKPDDLPPPYTELHIPDFLITQPPTHTTMDMGDIGNSPGRHLVGEQLGRPLPPPAPPLPSDPVSSPSHPTPNQRI